jgi:superfamily II RNA helicase
MDPNVIFKHPHYSALASTGTGAHHAGQLLLWRLVLEELMSRGMLRLMIATGTVAAGVDFPARTVVITAHSKRGAEGFNVLTASEFQQMSGRAGRRGKDAVGICVIAPGVYSDARVIHEVIKRPPEPLRSAYFAAPATVLNLLKFRNVDDLTFTVQRSLAAFLDGKHAASMRVEAEREEAEVSADESLAGERLKKAEKRVRRVRRDADELQARQETLLKQALEGLQTLGYVESGSLTEKGYWAANLCTSLVLELGEAIAEHLFSDLGMFELVGLVASIAGDPHRPYMSIKANPVKKEYFTKLQAIIERVRASYRNPAASEVAVLPDAAVTVITWMESESWDEFASLLRLNGVAEGDVARLVTQTADHLNQIARLDESHPELARLAAEGRKRILKPPLTEAMLQE